MISVKSGRRGTKSPDPQRTNGLEPSQFGCRQLLAAFVANQRQTRKNLTRHRRKGPVDRIYFRTEEVGKSDHLSTSIEDTAASNATFCLNGDKNDVGVRKQTRLE